MIYGLATLYYDNGELVDFTIDSLLDTDVYNNDSSLEEISIESENLKEDLHNLMLLKIGPSISTDLKLVHLSFSTNVKWIKSYNYFEGVEYDAEIDPPTILTFVTTPNFVCPKEPVIFKGILK